jgi:uncharacterized membrane protein
MSKEGEMTHRTEIRGAEVDTRSVRDRFGGIDTPAALMGMFAAFGVLVFLGALIAAGAGEIDYQLNAIDVDGNLQDVEVMGVAMALIIVFISFLLGGWAAGRMARYDGAKNGLGVALWTILLVAVFATLGALVGAEYNAFQQAGLPDWFSQLKGDEVTLGAVLAAVLAVAAVVGSAMLGGHLGAAYHRKVDAALADASASDGRPETVGTASPVDTGSQAVPSTSTDDQAGWVDDEPPSADGRTSSRADV